MIYGELTISVKSFICRRFSFRDRPQFVTREQANRALLWAVEVDAFVLYSNNTLREKLSTSTSIFIQFVYIPSQNLAL